MKNVGLILHRALYTAGWTVEAAFTQLYPYMCPARLAGHLCRHALLFSVFRSPACAFARLSVRRPEVRSCMRSRLRDFKRALLGLPAPAGPKLRHVPARHLALAMMRAFYCSASGTLPAGMLHCYVSSSAFMQPAWLCPLAQLDNRLLCTTLPFFPKLHVGSVALPGAPLAGPRGGGRASLSRLRR